MLLALHAGAAAAQRTIPGCLGYTDGKCIECQKVGYVLIDGTCKCADGWGRAAPRRECRRIVCSSLRCGATYIPHGINGTCSCDYYCDYLGDCCGGAASKNQACPNMKPTLERRRASNCASTTNEGPLTGQLGYRPGICWCDGACRFANDCCGSCDNCGLGSRAVEQLAAEAGARAAAVAAEAEAAAAAAAEEAAAAAAAAPPLDPEVAALDAEQQQLVLRQAQLDKPHDCHTSSLIGRQRIAAIAAASAAAAAAAAPAAADIAVNVISGSDDTTNGTVPINRNYQLVAERKMQACQAKETGPPPSVPYEFDIFFVSASVCNLRGQCAGGMYNPALNRAVYERQVAFLNAVWNRMGVAFKWDGVVRYANASSMDQVVGPRWICALPRPEGRRLSIHVVTAPYHLGGALGFTITPDNFFLGGFTPCYNWIHIYEKTLPGLGGVSKVDNQLVDNGHVLAHEVGHQLMLRHTWYEAEDAPISVQCRRSADYSAQAVLDNYSDGVRDTMAQTRNFSDNAVTDILRFVNCAAVAGSYFNTTAYAQQSCNGATGFPQGDNYYNNYNNIMSYGDKTCLKTFTPGQGARARCAIKCIWLGERC